MEGDEPRPIIRKSLTCTVPDIIGVRVEQFLQDKRILPRQFLIEAVVRYLHAEGYWEEDKWYGGTWEPLNRK